VQGRFGLVLHDSILAPRTQKNKGAVLTRRRKDAEKERKTFLSLRPLRLRVCTSLPAINRKSALIADNARSSRPSRSGACSKIGLPTCGWREDHVKLSVLAISTILMGTRSNPWQLLRWPFAAR
jgi:hypothetical protein